MKNEHGTVCHSSNANATQFLHSVRRDEALELSHKFWNEYTKPMLNGTESLNIPLYCNVEKQRTSIMSTMPRTGTKDVISFGIAVDGLFGVREQSFQHIFDGKDIGSKAKSCESTFADILGRVSELE